MWYVLEKLEETTEILKQRTNHGHLWKTLILNMYYQQLLDLHYCLLLKMLVNVSKIL